MVEYSSKAETHTPVTVLDVFIFIFKQKKVVEYSSKAETHTPVTVLDVFYFYF